MKKFQFILILSCLLLFSCGKNSDQEKNQEDNLPLKKMGEVFDKSKSAKDMISEMPDLKENTDRLRKMQPISTADLKNFFPEKLYDLERKSFSIGDSRSFFNLTQGEASYGNDGDQQIKIIVTDGAGEAGSAVIPSAIWALKKDADKQSENENNRSLQKDGHFMKIYQNQHDEHIDSSLEMEVDNRFLVKIEAQNLTAEELEKVYQELDFYKLK